jgi:hypothetical protein
LTIFIFGCRQKNDRVPIDTTPLATGLGGLAPEGWHLYDEVRRFTPESLYEKINGRAEFYLAYNMVEMTFAGFENSSNDEQFIDISIYDMGAATNAFGVFSAERSHEGVPLELGRNSYRSGANYYIWKGQYYIQIFSSDITEDLQQIGKDLAQSTTDLVPDTGEPIWGLNALPKENRVPGSERYFLVDAMSLDFMSNTYMAEYEMEGATVSAFLSQQSSPDAALEIIDRFLEHANRYGKDVKRVSVEGLDLTSCDMGGSYDAFFSKGHLVAGVTAVANQDIAVRASVDLWENLPDK